MIWAWVRWDKSPNSISSKSRGRARQSFCSCWRPRGRVSSGRALIRGLGFTRSEQVLIAMKNPGKTQKRNDFGSVQEGKQSRYRKTRENAKIGFPIDPSGGKTRLLWKNTGFVKKEVISGSLLREILLLWKKTGKRPLLIPNGCSSWEKLQCYQKSRENGNIFDSAATL